MPSTPSSARITKGGWSNLISRACARALGGRSRYVGLAVKPPPGPRPPAAKKRCLEDIRGVLNGAAGRHLRPIEVLRHGHVHFESRPCRRYPPFRFSSVCFSPATDRRRWRTPRDRENWFETHPSTGAYSNNSALARGGCAIRRQGAMTFNDLFERIRESGEPGFYFSENEHYGANLPGVGGGNRPLPAGDGHGGG